MRFAVALSVSVLLHGLLAMWLVCASQWPSRREAVRLEVSPVAFSFAEMQGDTVEAVQPKTSSEAVRPKPMLARCEPPLMRMEVALSESMAEVERNLPAIPETVEVLEMPRSAMRQARLEAPPRPCGTIRPDYPREARLRGEQGDVRLKVEVSPEGSVSEIAVVSSSGFARLDEAAVTAVRATRFTPAVVDGLPVAAAATLTLSFRLR